MKYWAILAVLAVLSVPVFSADTFTVKVEIPESYRQVAAGDAVWATTTIFNMGSTKRIDVTLRFDILDSGRVSRASKTKTIAVETQVSSVESLQLPSGLPVGRYSYVVTLVSPERSFIGEDVFEVKGKAQTSSDNSGFSGIILLAIGTIILVAGAFLGAPLFREYLEKRALRGKIRSIVQSRLSRRK